MISRQRLATFLLSALLFMAAAEGIPAKAALPQRVVIFTVYSDASKMPMYQEFFDAFEQKTGIKVDFRVAPGLQVDKWAQVITQVIGNIAPDVVGGNSVEFVQYAAQGLLQPLDEYILRDNAPIKTITPILVEPLKWRGKQYELPFGASAVTLFYNTRLFNEAGLAQPSAQWNDPAWTWDTFLAAARRLTKRDSSNKPSQYGVSGALTDNWISLPYNWGGDWIDADLKRFTGNQPGALLALQDQQDLRWTYGVMPRPGEPGSDFYNGVSAMGVLGTWNLSNVMQSSQILRMAPWFKVGGNYPRGAINTNGFAVLAAAPHKEEAWEFVKFATMDPVGNYLYCQAAGSLPGVRQAYQRWHEAMQAQAPNLNSGIFVDLVAEHGAIINIRKLTTFNDLNTVMTAAYNDVINNKKSAKQAMDEAAPVVQAYIDTSER